MDVFYSLLDVLLTGTHLPVIRGVPKRGRRGSRLREVIWRERGEIYIPEEQVQRAPGIEHHQTGRGVASSLGYSQGSHSHGKSWENLEFETILESHGFLSFFKKSWQTDISRKKSWKSYGILQKLSVPCRYMAMEPSSRLDLQVYYFHALLCAYYNVRVVMVVAVRGSN